jgi:hypothetical protein
MISDSLAFQILANQERLKCYQKVTDIKVGLFGLEAGKLGPLYYKTHDGAILKSSREFVTVREAHALGMKTCFSTLASNLPAGVLSVTESAARLVRTHTPKSVEITSW